MGNYFIMAIFEPYKMLIGTRNEAKVDMVKKSFPAESGLTFVSLNDIPAVDDSNLVETSDYKENARNKAQFYFAKTGIPTISTDHIVWMEKWQKNNGIVTHIREEAGNGKKASDEEVMDFIEKFVRENGESKMKFIFAFSYADENGVYDFESEESNRTLQGKRCPTIRKGYPMDSYILDSLTGKYLVEQTDGESYMNFRNAVCLQLFPIILDKQSEPLVINSDGADAFRSDAPVVERDAVVCVVKHWAEEKYMGIRWLKNDWQGFVIGGIEEGEAPGETGGREVAEETGYKNVEFIKQLGGTVHSKFYQAGKKENRFAHFVPVLLSLKDGEQSVIAENEKALHEVVWLTPKEMDKFLNRVDMKIIWNRVKNNN